MGAVPFELMHHVLLRTVATLALVVIGAVVGFVGAARLLAAVLPSHGDGTSEEVALLAITDALELQNRSRAFRGGTVLAWFGRAELDLRDATLAPDARLDVRAILGGAVIRVPTTWRVVISGTAFAGSYDAGTAQPDAVEAPALTIHAVSVMGGVAVTN